MASGNSFSDHRPPWASSGFTNGSPRSRGSGTQNTIRRGPVGSYRAPTSAGSNFGNSAGRNNAFGSNWSNRSNSNWGGNSRFASHRGSSNFARSFGNSRFGAASLANTSYSRFGSYRGFNRFDRFDRFGGYRHFDRFDHFGFGFGGYSGGGWGWGDPFWFLGDLFGLALNLGELSLGWPAWGLVGVNLLDAGAQALSSTGGDNGDYGYGDSNQSNPGYGYQQQAYTPLCGNYYSDENPGCLQQY